MTWVSISRSSTTRTWCACALRGDVDCECDDGVAAGLPDDGEWWESGTHKGRTAGRSPRDTAVANGGMDPLDHGERSSQVAAALADAGWRNADAGSTEGAGDGADVMGMTDCGVTYDPTRWSPPGYAACCGESFAENTEWNVRLENGDPVNPRRLPDKSGEPVNDPADSARATAGRGEPPSPSSSAVGRGATG